MISDCSAVSCLKPDCDAGFELFTPEGECCPECRLGKQAIRIITILLILR